MSATIRLDVDSATPHYEQIRAQLAAMIATGRLHDGERLPTIRALANDLGIAPGTVARAFRDLERAGLVTTRRKLGTLVTAPPATLDQTVLEDEARRFVTAALERGLDDRAVHDLVSGTLLALGAPSHPRSSASISSTPNSRSGRTVSSEAM